VGERVGPEEKGAEAADGDADLLGELAHRAEVGLAGLRRQLALEGIVELHAVKARVLAQLQAVPQRHLLRIRQRPEVDRLLHVVLLPGLPGRGGGRGGRALGLRRRGKPLRRHERAAERRRVGQQLAARESVRTLRAGFVVFGLSHRRVSFAWVVVWGRPRLDAWAILGKAWASGQRSAAVRQACTTAATRLFWQRREWAGGGFL